ncbi:hypothetical protein pb186bvf_013198 [Paramecium bursaria]
METRITSIFKVDCQKHNNKPIQSCDYVNNLKLACQTCQKEQEKIQQSIYITLENISNDIVCYYNTAKTQREKGLKQLEAFTHKIHTYFKTFLEQIDEDLKTIKKSLIEMKYFEEIESQWINDTTSSVKIEDLSNLVKIWSGIYVWDQNQSKIRDQFKSDIKEMLKKIEFFSENLVDYGKAQLERKVKQAEEEAKRKQLIQNGLLLDNSDIIINQDIIPQRHPEIIQNKTIDRLIILDPQQRTFEKYNVCHFRVLLSCRLKTILMPPVLEDVVMIFGIHNKINQQPQEKQEINITKNPDPQFYNVNSKTNKEKISKFNNIPKMLLKIIILNLLMTHRSIPNGVNQTNFILQKGCFHPQSLNEYLLNSLNILNFLINKSLLKYFSILDDGFLLKK